MIMRRCRAIITATALLSERRHGPRAPYRRLLRYKSYAASLHAEMPIAGATGYIHEVRRLVAPALRAASKCYYQRNTFIILAAALTPFLAAREIECRYALKLLF